MYIIQKLIMRYYLIPLLILIAQVMLASNDNIVIASSNETYKIEASKDGASLSKVKAHKEIVYEATRTAGNALALEFYDDYVKIDKASASGAKAQYRHWIPEDIFIPIQKCVISIFHLKRKVRRSRRYLIKLISEPIILPKCYSLRFMI